MNSFELLNNLLNSFKFVYITIHINYFLILLYNYILYIFLILRVIETVTF